MSYARKTYPVTDETIAEVMNSEGKVCVSNPTRRSRRFRKPVKGADGRWFVRVMNEYHKAYIETITWGFIDGERLSYGSVEIGPRVWINDGGLDDPR